jgi:hypothetical protein
MSLGKGLTAGMVGTELLNVATYLDMAIRGRGASSVPQDDVQALAERTGVPLGEGEAAENRKTAVGTLLGYATGAGIGLAYGAGRPLLRHLPTLPAAVLVGVAAMAATDATSAALGTTDPRSWSPQDWLADLVPHVAYGLGVVATHDALDRR